MKYSILIFITFFTVNTAFSQLINKAENNELKFFQVGNLPVNWKLEYSAENQQQIVCEYTSNGESIQKWSQLITEQFHKKVRKEILLKYVSSIKEQLEKSSKGLTWKIISKSEGSIIYEWSHQGSGTFPPTYEITKLITHNGGLYRLAYDKYTKAPDVDTKYWKDIILKSKLK
jgi:hypothetical protein